MTTIKKHDNKKQDKKMTVNKTAAQGCCFETFQGKRI